MLIDWWSDLKQSERMRFIIALQECARKKGNGGGGGDGSGNVDASQRWANVELV